MNFTYDFSFELVSVLTAILAWSVLGYLALRIYKKQTEKPKVWKIVIVLFIGLFSFSINFNLFEEMFKIAILPLGVWILYFVLNGRHRWQAYRSYAWLGFWSNFIFLFSAIVSTPIHHVIYPQNELSTYISTIDHASINVLYPTAKNLTLKKEKLLEQLPDMKQQKIYSEQWYAETYTNAETNKKERFPYQLIGVSSKWGSGINSIIYIEEDGKGILLSTSKNQLYFRSEDSILEGGE
jgi:hypothetical protein